MWLGKWRRGGWWRVQYGNAAAGGHKWASSSRWAQVGGSNGGREWWAAGTHCGLLWAARRAGWPARLLAGLLHVGNQVGALLRLLQASEHHLGACTSRVVGGMGGSQVGGERAEVGR